MCRNRHLKKRKNHWNYDEIGSNSVLNSTEVFSAFGRKRLQDWNFEIFERPFTQRYTTNARNETEQEICKVNRKMVKTKLISKLGSSIAFKDFLSLWHLENQYARTLLAKGWNKKAKVRWAICTGNSDGHIITVFFILLLILITILLISHTLVYSRLLFAKTWISCVYVCMRDFEETKSLATLGLLPNLFFFFDISQHLILWYDWNKNSPKDHNKL